MATELKISRATVEDVPALVPLFDAYRVYYGRPSDLPLARKFLLERLGAKESVIFFCRQSSSEEPVGFAQLYPSFSSVSAGRIWILNDLFVAPEARRLGVGRVLVKASHDHARETGAVRVVVSTAHTNQAAQELYKALGYTHDSEFRSYSFRIPTT